jgi:hypothetical protein
VSVTELVNEGSDELTSAGLGTGLGAGASLFRVIRIPPQLDNARTNIRAAGTNAIGVRTFFTVY